MSSPDEAKEQLGVKLHTLPFRDTISTVPIKKRRLFFPKSPSPPPETQSSRSIDYKTGDPLHDLIRDDCNDRGQVENDKFSDEKLVSFEGIERTSEPVGRADFAIKAETLDSKNISNEASASEINYGNASFDRSNWDLNMTMDTWEESPSDSAMKNHECDANGGPEFSSLLGGNLTSAGSSNGTFLSLDIMPESGLGVYNSETEACLDLLLKPSFVPESDEKFFNLGKVDYLKFLSLSMNPSSSASETTKIVCGAVKSESKTETFVLKTVKSESCEIEEASRIIDSGLVYSSSVAAIKSEPVEERDLPQDHSHLRSYDNNLLKSANFMDSNTKDDSHMKDMKCEVDNMIQVMKGADEGSERADFFIKRGSEEGQKMNLQIGSWEDDKTDNLQEESDVVSRLSETDSKTEPGEETYLDADVIECCQNDKELSFQLEEECDNECEPGSSHAVDGVIGAVFEKGGVDSRVFEDGELRDEASLRGNAGCHLIHEIEKSEDVSVAVESPEISKDPGTVECVNNVDPSVAADLQESSSVTGDSTRREMSRTTRRDSSRKDKMSERKTKFDRDPTIDKKGDGGGAVGNSGGNIESSFPLSSESKKDPLIGGVSGRIINLNSASSRNMNRIHESPLSSRIDREKSADKSLKRQKFRFGRSRDEDPREGYHEFGNEKQRRLACGKSGLGSVNMRTRGRSNSSHSRVGDERQRNQFGGRSFDLNYTRDQIHDHDDFRYSRPIPPAEVTMNSRISRKVSNHTGEVHSELGYVSQPKSRRKMPDKMLNRVQPHEQFDRTDRIPAHRERLSLSPRSRGMSPAHWPAHTAPEGFNGPADMVQCRSEAPVVMQESMRSTMFARRRGSGHGSRSHEDMMETGSSFPRRDFSRKIYSRQVTDEYDDSSFARGQIRELPVDRESAVIRRRYGEARDPVRYRHRCIDDDDEDFSFHAEEGPPGSYGYHAKDDRGFNGGGCSSEVGGRFKNRLGNASRRYRDMEEEQHEDGFRHQAELGWNDSGFTNDRPRSSRY